MRNWIKCDYDLRNSVEDWHYVNLYYRDPCLDCGSWNPVKCNLCDKYLKIIFNCTPNWGKANDLLRAIEKHFDNSLERLYSWEDYETP